MVTTYPIGASVKQASVENAESPALPGSEFGDPRVVSLGWDVSMASLPGAVPPSGGRLLVCPTGSSGFMWDTTAGYPNWGRTQNTVTENEKLTRDAIYWLTRKSSGMSILLFRRDISHTWGDLGFVNFVERSDDIGPTFSGPYGPWTSSVGLSGTVTITNTAPDNQDWTLHDWDGFDPTAYDLVILPTYSLVYNSDAIDEFLTSHGGKIWASVGGGASTLWNRYGITIGSGTQSGGGSPDWLRPAFACSEFGVGTYQYGIYSSQYISLYSGGNSMGGRTRTFPANTGNDAIGLLEQLIW